MIRAHVRQLGRARVGTVRCRRDVLYDRPVVLLYGVVSVVRGAVQLDDLGVACVSVRGRIAVFESDGIVEALDRRDHCWQSTAIGLRVTRTEGMSSADAIEILARAAFEVERLDREIDRQEVTHV